jgi:hypothetical protein
MRVDLQSRSTGTISFLSTCRATVPMLLILMACLSCSTPPVEMSQPRYGVVGPLAFLFSDPLTKGDDRQSAHRRLNAQPTLRHDEPKIAPSPKVTKAHRPITTGAFAPRRASEKPNPPTLSDAEKDQLFQEFLEWRKHQTEVP